MAQLRVHTALAEDWCLVPRPVGSPWVSARTCTYVHIHTEGCGQWYSAAFTHRRGLALLTGCRCEKSRSRLGTAGSALGPLAGGRGSAAGRPGFGARRPGGPRRGRGRRAGADLGALPAACWLWGRGGSSAGSRRRTGFGRRLGRPADRAGGPSLGTPRCRLPCPLARGARHGRLARLGQRQPAEVQ